jgi:AcrR family transcriptional regulator
MSLALRRISGCEDLVSEGTSPPAGIPPEIFAAALSCHLHQRRLDMKTLALELGIGRATLYRKVASRDHLLGEILWYLTRRVLARALRETAELSGRDRVLTVIRLFNELVCAQPDLRRFLDAEPETALRVLTSRQGPVQAGLVGAVERLLLREVVLEDLEGALNAHTLAYVIVRIGESFLYADVIGHGEPDVDAAMQIVERLLDSAIAVPERTAA